MEGLHERMGTKYLILLLPLYAAFSFVTSAPTVNTTTALITGCEVNYGKTKVNQFLGIPFAQPPVGDLRFRKTAPLEGWSGEINATKYPPACNQHYSINYDVVDQLPGKSEDCLYMNIWTPCDASPDNPKAVMFWLFAGSYTTGSNRLPLYNGTLLAAKGDVIVVTPNYRLGIFGFLYTSSEDAPGNMGLYDVREALKWVNLNIGAFGGDKNKITIAGSTAGSLTIGLLTVSPQTEGMFRSVIMESEADITVRKNVKQYNLEIGQKVACLVGCASESKTLQNNTEEVIQCLKNKTAEELTKAVSTTGKTSLITFIPVYNDEFLPNTPAEAYQNGPVLNVSVLIGDNRNEGTFQLVSDNADVFGPYGEKDPNVNKTYGRQLINNVLRSDNIDSNSWSQITDYYLSNFSDTDYNRIRNQTAKALGDINILCNDYYFASGFSKRGPVYYYYYIHRTRCSKFANWTGATLFSEVPYVFGVPIYDDSQYTKEEAQLSSEIVQLWTNFVKEGVPSDDWKKFNCSDDRPYVKILQVEGDCNDDPYKRFKNCEFLKQYIAKYGAA